MGTTVPVPGMVLNIDEPLGRQVCRVWYKTTKYERTHGTSHMHYGMAWNGLVQGMVWNGMGQGMVGNGIGKRYVVNNKL